MLRFLTAGESHGKALTGILEGMVANLALSSRDIDQELRRRQEGYGRGGRMKIEKDKVQILSGVRKGKTLGSPISLIIDNRDWVNWEDVMAIEAGKATKLVTNVRPGHADLAGVLKYNQKDIRNILERSSARETAMRVAIGSICKKFLSEFKISVTSKIDEVGGETAKKLFHKAIDSAKANGDSLGGIFEVIVNNVPVGLGSHVHYDRRIDGLLAQAVMSIPAIKGVEIGYGFASASLRGSMVHDEIYYKGGKFHRKTNAAGGIEGGITNGEPIIVRAAMKPIPTLRKPLRSVNIKTKKAVSAHFERSDTCAIEAASVIAEAMVAFVLAQQFLLKFGGDSLEEVKSHMR